MGYSYGLGPNGRYRLSCDGCGKTGGVRKRKCPYRVHYAEGGSLPYCYPSALCAECYKKNKHKLHEGCEAGAAKSTAAEMVRKAKREAGGLERKSAWGDWHPTVPEGKVGVLFVGGEMTPNVINSGTKEEWRLVTKADYEAGSRGDWLTDYPNAEVWEPHA